MTKEQLARANALQKDMDVLYRQLEDLEVMKKLCLEDADIAKKTLHKYYIQASDIDGTCKKISIWVSAIGAFQAVCRDMEDIEKELEKLRKEFSDL